MEEKDISLPEEERTPAEEVTPEEEVPVKSNWQMTKESWYDKIPLTVKQLDIIIGCGIAGLVITFILIAMDAMGVF